MYVRAKVQNPESWNDESGALCYVLADADSDWVYVESADVRGFVARQYLNTGDEVTTQ